MPFAFLLRSLFSLVSLALLGLGLWLGWRWYDENAYFTDDGRLQIHAVGWPLWIALGLLALSLLGKFVWVPLLARPGGAQSRLVSPDGALKPMPTGDALFVSTTRAAAQPIIFVHGSSLSGAVWTYARRDLAAHRVTVLDLPGLGRSHKGAPITMQSMADDLAAVIEQHGPPPIVVGHSMGGMIIQTLASRRPDLFDPSRIAGIALFNTTYTNPLRTMVLSSVLKPLQPLIELMCHLQRWLFPLYWLSAWQSYLSGAAHLANRLTFGRNVTREMLEGTTLISTRNSPARIAEGELAMLHWDATDALSFSRIPVLIVGGTVDPVTRPEASEYIASSCPTSTLVMMDGGNHMSFLDQWNKYRGALENALQLNGGTRNPSPNDPPFLRSV